MENRLIETAPDLLVSQDVADLLGATVATVHSMCKRGDLPAVKIGKRWYVPKAKLVEKLNNQSAASDADPYKDVLNSPVSLPGNDR